MADFGVTGEVVVTSGKAEAAFDRVGDKATQMANEVASAAGKAGQAVDGVGAGAEKSADKFTRAESRMRDAIKRSTQELQLLGKTASEKLEFNIQAKGLDAAKFAPYIEELKKAEAAQRIATGSLDKMGVSAAQTAAALRGVPAQFTDIITSLQGGQAPLTVFLQQGGQLKDMFGGAGNAARALGGYVLGLVNPFTIAAAAVAGIAVAYNQGAKEADAYRAALITTGNAAGTNAAQLKSYAQEISSVVGTQGKAAEALSALAATGKVGAENLREAAQAAVAYERATGQAASKTAEQFASLRNEPLAAVLKLNEGMNFLTDSTYKQIKSLEEQGKTAEAANVAQRAFADTLAGRAGEMERNLGTVERGWLAVKDAAKSAWDAILNVGRASTSVDQLSDVRKQIAARENQLANDGFGSNGGGAAFGRPSSANSARLSAELTALKAQAAALEGVAFASKTAAEEERQRSESVKASAAFDKAGERFLTDKVKMERELAVARTQGAEAGRSQAEIEKRLGEIRASYAKKGGGGVAAENKELRDQQRIFAELAGVSSTYYAELANAQKQRAAGVITEQQYVTAVQSLIEKQPFAVALAKEEAAAAKALSKSYAEAAAERIKTIQSMELAADSLQSQNDALRDEIELIGLSTEQQTLVLQQRNDVIILTKEATLAELERQSAITGTQTRVEIALASEIEALKERNALLGAKGVKNAAVDAAKTAKDEWQKTSDKINDTLTDALMRGFESGKDFAKNMRDTVVNMFNTMVLRPVISAIVNPVAGSVTSALGLSGAQGGGNSIMGGIQTASNLNTLYGAGAQALWGGTAGASAASLGYANIVGMAGGDAIGALATANGMWAGVATGAQAAAQAAIASNAAMAAGTAAALPAGTTAAAAGAGAGGASGALAAIPGWGWALAGVAALGMLAKKFDDSGTPHIGAGAVYSEAGGLQQGAGIYNRGTFGMGATGEYAQGTQAGVSAIATGLAQTFDGIAKAFGKTAGYEIATAFADDSSKDGAWGSLRISKDGADLLNWNDTRENKWAPREFANGEEGYKEYLAEIAKDTRTVLLDMDLPSWADTMLESIGDSASMDQLAATVQQIGVIQTTFVQLGKTMEGFAGLTDKAFEALMKASGGFESLAANAGTYYENFYSEAEKTAAVTRSVSDALAQVGVAMPTTRDEFRALVESQLALGESGAEAVAALLGVSGAFSQLATVGDTIAATRASLQDRLDALQGNDRAILDRQRKAEYDALMKLDPALAALIAQIYELEDAANIAATRGSLQDRLDALQGNDRAILDRRRKAEFDALYKLDPALAALVTQIYELEDASEAAARAEADRVAAIDKSLRNLQAAYAREQKVLEAQLDGIDQARTYFQEQQSLASESLGLITGVFDLLHDSVQNLYGDVEAAAAMQAEQGRAFIAQALTTAVTTGYLPEQDQLSEAIRAAVAGVNSGTYANTTEQDFAKLVLAGQLRALEEVTGKQKTDAEKQLDALEKQLKSLDDQTDAIEKQLKLQQESLDYWQEQIDIANGVYDATLSVEQAVRDLAALLGAEVVDNPPEPANGGGSGGGGAVFGGGSGSTPAPAPARYSRLVYGGTAGVGYEGVRDQSLIDRLDKLSPVYHSFDGTGDLAGLAAAMKAAGGTIADLSILSGNWESDWRNAFAGVGIPAFAVGTNYVPRDMVAQIHEGEAIVPKAFNPWAGGSMGSDNTALIAELRALRAEVAELRTAAEETAGATGATADVLVRVTQNGNGMVTAAAPI